MAERNQQIAGIGAALIEHWQRQPGGGRARYPARSTSQGVPGDMTGGGIGECRSVVMVVNRVKGNAMNVAT